MANARRRFVEAQRAQPKGKTGRADEALRYFAKLYRIEREIKALTLDERTKRRQTESKAVLAELHDWLEENIRIVTPRSKLGRSEERRVGKECKAWWLAGREIDSDE